MSRWSAERLRIALAPDRVDLVRQGAWWQRNGQRQASQRCTPGAGEPPWQAALAALDAALPGFAQRGDSVAVLLSNHWVRYLVLPWQPELSRSAELEQVARLRFEQTYGAAAAHWTLRIADGGWGAPALACAIDTALLAALQSRLAAAGLPLRSLQPLLMAAYNRVRQRLPGHSAFVLVEPGRVCLCLLEQGRWRQVSQRRAGADAAEAVEQELAALGSAELPATLDVLLVGDGSRWPALADRPVRLLGQPTDGTAGSLALCGLG